MKLRSQLVASLSVCVTVIAVLTLILGNHQAISQAKEGKTISHNRLINEKSPYLLQHAENPVDWYPWGDEAFEKAEKENKPIFLSIGYSTCHWCHVMEHESFEDPEVAALMNEAFVSIKVDREERPDIDNVYMTVAQMMTGSGGWPLTIIMTPDKKPFFAGTYFPKTSRFGRVGMMDLVPRVSDAWEERHAEVLESADQITTALQGTSDFVAGEELDKTTLDFAYQGLAQRFDRVHGGFSTAPKFPTPHNLLFLLRYWKRSGDDNILAMVEKTLQEMRRGGVYDHVGFGFHRYSTDERWFTPHFEKMLYDQAMLAMAYTETYQATGKEEYKKTAEEIFAYVMRDMTDAKGGFYSAEDADSEGEEGKFYLWSEEEIREILTKEEADLIVNVFNVQDDGNYAEEASGVKTGTNILYLNEPNSQIASRLKTSEDDLLKRLDAARLKLFNLRKGRIHPYKDDKVLTDWNGLMMAALAKGAQAFDEPAYSRAAVGAADFVFAEMLDADGRLLHRYRGGGAGIAANLDDYAFLIWGLIEVYEATFEVDYLQKALSLNEDLLEHFWDDGEGGFHFTAEDSEELLVRGKDIYDGAIPAGNSVAMLNLLRLARITAKPELEEKAAAIGRAFSTNVNKHPSVYTQLMAAVDFAVGPSYEVIIVGESEGGDTSEMVKALRTKFVPNKVVLFRPAEEESPEIIKLAEYAKYHSSQDGKATAYVCLEYICELPTTDIEKMLELLN